MRAWAAFILGFVFCLALLGIAELTFLKPSTEEAIARLEMEIMADRQREADSRMIYETYLANLANHGESDTVRCESGWLYIREREPYVVDSTMHFITAISKPLWQTTYGAPCTTRYNSSDKR